MATAFGVDQQVTASRDVAVLCMYLGYSIARVEVAPDKSEKFTIVCPACDFEIVTKEAASDETTVCYKSLQKANALVGSRIGYARKNGGKLARIVASSPDVNGGK